jgi:hypothetical protein
MFKKELIAIPTANPDASEPSFKKELVLFPRAINETPLVFKNFLSPAIETFLFHR